MEKTSLEAKDTEHTTASKQPDEIVPVINKDNIKHFQDLGLGRGIDSTDRFMWRNKAPILVRSITDDLSNVIGTNENGVLHEYEKTVSSLVSQQAKIKLAVNVPSSHVKIGLDGHYSQSTNSTITIKGTKVKTRTISFRFDFDDLPLGSVLKMPSDSFEHKNGGFQTFENNMATWILDYLRKKGVSPSIDSLKGPTAIEKLEEFTSHLGSVDSENSRYIGLACQSFVGDIGMTHYVNAIELGALSYSVESRKKTKSSKGIGGNLEAASAVTANTSVDISNELRQHTKQAQRIGHFDKDKQPMVEWNTPNEAVIGFQIEPISRLIRIGAIQLALNSAIQIYIQSKTNNTAGPFLISTTVNKKPVYWKVEEESVRGTESVGDASLFYFMPFEDGTFVIAYWGDEMQDRKLLTNVNNDLSELRTFAPNLPHFVTASDTTLGYSHGPLVLRQTFPVKSATFTLYSKLQSSFGCLTCISNQADIQIWMEGDEFFIKHETFLKKKFVSMKHDVKTGTYTTLMASRANAENPFVGILFRLHPHRLRATQSQPSSPSGSASKPQS